MRILIVNTIYPTDRAPQFEGGAEVSVRNLAEGLARAGHDVEALRLTPFDMPHAPEAVNGVRVSETASRNLYNKFAASRPRGAIEKFAWHFIDDAGRPSPELEACLDRFRPDVFHSNILAGISTQAWRAARRRNIPIVHTLRDYYLLCPRSGLFRHRRTCAKLCAECAFLTRRRRAATALVDAVVAISDRTLSLHLNHGLFDNARIKAVIANIAERKRKADLPFHSIGEVTFGFIGKGVPEKGIEELVEAFAAIPAGSAKLLIAGRVPDKMKLVLEGTGHGRKIEYLGFVRPEDFYGRVDVVVAPSIWDEPLGRSVLEAKAYGRPAIVSNRGGLPYALGSEASGWIFDPDEAGSLASIIKEIVASPSCLSEKATAAYADTDRFSEAAIVSAHVDLYRAVIRQFG